MAEITNFLLKLNNNLILTGAPGVGKTYTTAEIAVALCDKSFTPSGKTDAEKRKSLMTKYNDLVKSGQIAFTTFHQSLDYEEFVEGLKPEITDDGQVTYEVKSGIFKQICERATKNIENLKKINFIETFIETFIDKSIEDKKEFETPKNKVKYQIVENKEDAIILNKLTSNDRRNKKTDSPPKDPILTLSKKDLVKILNYDCEIDKWDEVNKIIEQDVKYEIGQYLFALYKAMLPEYKKQTENKIKKYILIIDEINRGNISKIFGELITLLEKDKRLGEENEITVTLPYSQETFGVPSNLYIIGTMNTADRSIGAIDYALRRRFAFYSLKSNPDLVTDTNAKSAFDRVKRLIEARINPDLDADDIMIGHSYFMKDFENNLKYQIIPLLQEYDKDGLINLEDEERKELKNGNIPEVNA